MSPAQSFPLRSVGFAVALLFVPAGVCAQYRYHDSPDNEGWFGEVVVDRHINITFDKSTLTRFYDCFCRNWSNKIEQPYYEKAIKPDKKVKGMSYFEATRSPESIRVTMRAGNTGNNFMCIVASGGYHKITCTRMRNAVAKCVRRDDCELYHLKLDPSISGECLDICVNIGWIATYSVRFGLSARAGPKFPVISKDLCPDHPWAKLQTTASTHTPSTNSTASASHGSSRDRALSDGILIALIVASVLLVLLIVSIILFIVCYWRKLRDSRQKQSIGVQTRRRPIRSSSFQRLALLSQNLFRTPRRVPQTEATAPQVGPDPEPIYYEISNSDYEEPVIVPLGGPEGEPKRDKGRECLYRKLPMAGPGTLGQAEDSNLRTYGKVSASPEIVKPPDLVPAGELGGDRGPQVLPLSVEGTARPQPKPRNRTSQSTFKIRN